MYNILLFDLDGTLTDPEEGITKSIKYALGKMGIQEESQDKLTSFIGPPLKKAFKENYDMSDEEAAQALLYYRERFSKTGLYENSVFPGIHELLGSLAAQSKRLFVATSKPTEYSVKILEHFGLIDFFEAVIGSNLDGTRTEKAEVIQFALSQLGAYNRDEIVMIGDRKHDVIGAKSNNIDVIGVTYGFGSYEELATTGPNHIVSSIAELETLLSAGPTR